MGSDIHNKKDIKGDGTVVIHQRENRHGEVIPTWYMRIRIPLPQSKGYVRKSTNEINEARAMQIALNTYDELYSKVKSGGTLETITYKKLLDMFCEYFPAIPKNKGRNKKYIENFLTQLKKYPYDYFVKVKNNISIDKINTGMLDDYFVYQMKNTYINGKKKEPTKNTINKYATALGMLFKYAYDRKLIPQEIHVNKQSYKDERRPAFTRTEWRKLTRGLREYVKSNEQSNHFRSRFYLQHFILISANCGARVGEIRKLRWVDIIEEMVKDKEVIYAVVDGKTGQREMVFQPAVKPYLDRLKEFRKNELGKDIPEKEVLFCHYDGKPIHSFKKSFERMLESLKLLYNSKGKKRTIYSLRHTYATFRIEDEVNPHLLARQMGTSIKMLEQHYLQHEGKLVAQQITKTSSQRTVPTSLVDELYQDKVIDKE